MTWLVLAGVIVSAIWFGFLWGRAYERLVLLKMKGKR